MILKFRSALLMGLAATVGGGSVSALAADDIASTPVTLSSAPSASMPTILTADQKSAYTQAVSAIRGQRWGEAKALLDANSNGPLAAYLRAELLLAAGSPRAELRDLMPLLERSPELPQAQQLGRLASKRGATTLPQLPPENDLRWAGSAPRRIGAESIAGDPVAAELARSIPDRIKNDDPAGAEALLTAAQDRLSPAAREEWQQKIAWSYYIENDDADALRLATACAGGSSAWATQAAWVKGLAAWRMQDYRTAIDAFDRVSRDAPDSELRAAGFYWASRAATAMGHPAGVQPRLQSAAANGETLYGLLASEALGTSAAPSARSTPSWQDMIAQPNVRTAIALHEIGADDWANVALRHQARIGNPDQHAGLVALADALSLPEAQLFLAHNTPYGREPVAAARYPSPHWQPNGGWKVDPSLVFAHTLQESRFQRSVVSAAGAMGLMQVRPGTASDLARWRGDVGTTRDLRNPAVNMDFGQSYLQFLSTDSSTGGLLPKVIAAYNAGPSPVARWSSEIKDGGDPLLFMESIPYWETRGYVAIVLRNYWMYEAKAGKDSASRAALAQGKWPRFPSMGGGQMSFASASHSAN